MLDGVPSGQDKSLSNNNNLLNIVTDCPPALADIRLTAELQST